MKSLIFIFSLLISTCLFSQEKTDTYTSAIFPGCKESKENQYLKSCFNEKFNYLFSEAMSSLSSNFNFLLIEEFSKKVDFKVMTNGNLQYDSQTRENGIIGIFSEFAFNIINLYLEENGKITPAITNNGQVAILNFTTPIQFAFNETYKIDIKSFQQKNRIIANNTFEGKNFTIVMTPALELIVLENNKKIQQFNDLTSYKNFAAIWESESFRTGKTIIVNNDQYLIESDHWLKPSSTDIKIYVHDKLNSTHHTYEDIEKFLTSTYADLIFLP